MRITRIPVATVILTLAACGDSGGGTAPSVLTLRVTPSSVALASLGETATLTARVVDRRGEAVSGRSFTWSSDAPDVATAEAGTVTAVSNGDATVTVMSDDLSTTVPVTVDQELASVAVEAGDGQSGVVGSPLAEAVAVSVADARENPIEGEEISLRVTAGGGSVEPADPRTDAEGRASAVWTLGPDASVEHRLAVEAGEVDTAFTATAEAASPATIRVLSGDGQEGLAREELGDPLRIGVEDRFGNPIPLAPLVWSVEAGGGSLSGSDADESGAATATWTLGPVAGEGVVAVTAGDDVGAEFTATILANGVIRGSVTGSDVFLAPGGGPEAEMRPRSSRSSITDRPGALSFPNSGARAEPTALRWPQEARTLPGEYVVRFHSRPLGAPPVGSAAFRFRSTAEDVGRRIRGEFESIERELDVELQGVSPVLLGARIGIPVDEVGTLERLRARPGVASVEPVVLYHAAPAAPLRTGAGHAGASAPLPRHRARTARSSVTSDVPPEAADEPLYPTQAWHYDISGVLDAWKVTTGDRSVVVAVVDDGIRFDHPDIADNLTGDGYDFVSHFPLAACTSGSFSTSMDGDGYDPDPTIPAALIWDEDGSCVSGLGSTGGHGLHVAGTIGARAGNGIGGVGVAWNVRIRPIRVLGSNNFGTNYDIAQGILYAAGLPADNGAGGTVQTSRVDVINLSLGGPGDSPVMQDAVEAAAGEGVLMIASAMNASNSTPHFPASYPEVVSVSSVAPDFTLASYSSFGSGIEIAAPGGELSEGGDWGVISTRWDFDENGPTYSAMQGTSMAAPHVSGIAALILSSSPGLSADQVRSRLTTYASDLGAAGRDDEFGHGLVHAGASVREGVWPPVDTHVLLYDDESGEIVIREVVERDGSFEIGALEDGSYRVYAGEDRGDGEVGLFSRRWGAAGGSMTPDVVTIQESSIHTRSFDIGLPFEVEPNDSDATASPLPLGGYAYGWMESSSAVDVYELRVPRASNVVIETGPLMGACGLAGQTDPALTLRDSSGALVAQDAYEDPSTFRFCATIEERLDPGTYAVEVSGLHEGHYAIGAREAR